MKDILEKKDLKISCHPTTEYDPSFQYFGGFGQRHTSVAFLRQRFYPSERNKGRCWEWNAITSVWEASGWAQWVEDWPFWLFQHWLWQWWRGCCFPRGQQSAGNLSGRYPAQQSEQEPFICMYDCESWQLWIGDPLCLVSSSLSNLAVTATESVAGRYGFFSPHLLCQSLHRLYLITYSSRPPEPDCKPCHNGGIRKKSGFTKNLQEPLCDLLLSSR